MWIYYWRVTFTLKFKMGLSTQNKKLILLGILVLILIFVLFRNIGAARKKAATVTRTAAQTAVSGLPDVSTVAASSLPVLPAVDAAQKKEIKMQAAREKELSWEKDPFYPRTSKITSRQGGLSLKGISWRQKGASFAVINEEIVQEGDAIRDWKIEKIEKTQVILLKDGQRYILALEE